MYVEQTNKFVKLHLYWVHSSFACEDWWSRHRGRLGNREVTRHFLHIQFSTKGLQKNSKVCGTFSCAPQSSDADTARYRIQLSGKLAALHACHRDQELTRFVVDSTKVVDMSTVQVLCNFLNWLHAVCISPIVNDLATRNINGNASAKPRTNMTPDLLDNSQYSPPAGPPPAIYFCC